ncbi:replication initiation factor domain-containing protein [Neisseria sp. S1]|uniref:replication initiation factor domain-containing protein n=1 Tax=Neisseria sp. S1 TaxID=3318354 RepID=UPI003A8C5815
MISSGFIKTLSADSRGECAVARITRETAERQFDNPPASNTGGLVSEAYQTVVMVNGKAKEILLKKGSSSAAFIDTLTITMSEDVFVRPDQLGTDEEIAANASAEIQEIMGFGLFCQQNGRNGYAISYKMGNQSENYGFFAMGGRQQKNTVCLFFTGVGLTAALSGWESRLYEFLQSRAPGARITRIDLAHDFLDGEYTPNQALKDWESGLYTSRHTKPIAECVGGDWLEYRGTGKTLYIGSRKNASRFARIYEKGKQLGDLSSNWVRAEVEMHNRDIVIPHDILLSPGSYMTAAYPAFEILFSRHTEAPKKIERVKKTKDVSIEHVLKYASMQSSPSINMMEDLGFTPEQIVAALKGGKDKMPKRLSSAAFDCDCLNVKFIHEFKRLPYSAYEVIEKLGVELDSAPRLNHRSYEEYERLKRLKSLAYLNKTDDVPASRRSYEEYLYDRYATPSFILNRKYKGNENASNDAPKS